MCDKKKKKTIIGVNSVKEKHTNFTNLIIVDKGEKKKKKKGGEDDEEDHHQSTNSHNII